MSEEQKSTELVDIHAQVQAELNASQNYVPAPSGRNITTANRVFNFPDGSTSADPFRAIVLDHRNINRYYTEAYNPQEPKPPKCFAINKDINEMAPDPEVVTEPQAETCADCALNKFGSAPTGKGKACRNQVRIAVVLENSDETAEPMVMHLPPTALKGWASYYMKLQQHGKLPFQVVTEIALDPNSPYQLPVLTAVDVVDENRLGLIWQLRQDAEPYLDAAPMQQ